MKEAIMMKERITALVLALAMVMSTAAFVFADDEQPEEPAVKAEQVIEAAAEKTVVVGRGASLGVKLTTGDGALAYESSDPETVAVSEDGTIKAKAVGKAVITVTAAETEGFSAAEAQIVVKVVPKKVTITSLFCKKHGKFTVKRKKLKGLDGVQVEFSRSKSFKKAPKIKTAKGSRKTQLEVKKLKKGAKYYVRIRVYKLVGEERFYSDWSKAKPVRIK